MEYEDHSSTGTSSSTLRRRILMQGRPWQLISIAVSSTILLSCFSSYLFYGELHYEFPISGTAISLLISYVMLVSFISYRDALQKEIDERIKAQQKLAQQAELLNQMNADKDRFFSIISHDLRSPLAVILGVSNILENEALDSTPGEVLNYASRIAKGAQNLNNLLENLLQWSRLQSGTIQYQPQSIDLSATIDERIDLLMPQADDKNIQITSRYNHLKSEAHADPDMIGSLLHNLLSNAIKFSKEENSITIATHLQDQRIHISVSDTGIGLSHEAQYKLFDLDTQHTQGTDGESGSGLGLILCQQFAQHHGSDITVSSAVDQGSTFTFSIPVSEPTD